MNDASLVQNPPPIPVLPLEYAPPTLGQPSPLLRIMGWISMAVLWCGTIACYVNVESVLASGPALALVGLIMLVCGIARRRTDLWLPGLAHWAICLFFVGLVNLLHWGPHQARWPFSVMSTIYTLVLTALLIRAIKRERQRIF